LLLFVIPWEWRSHIAIQERFARQNNECAQTRGVAAERVHLLAWHKPFFRFNPSPVGLAS